MRLDTAEKRAAYRAASIPEGAIPDRRNGPAGAVYIYGDAYPLAIAFRGSSGRPEWHFRFKTQEHLEARVNEFFASIAASQEFKAKRRAASAGFEHDVKVGDIFRSSWGYDQTNIDYYQCVRLVGKKMMEVREICEQSEDTGWLQGQSVPAPNHWATEPDYSDEGKAYKAEHGYYPTKEKPAFRVLIQGSEGSEPYFKVASYAIACRMKPVAEVAGVKMYKSSHWTAYH